MGEAAPIRCSDCDRMFRPNTIGIHRRSHDAVAQAARRVRKNERQRAYARSEPGVVAYRRYRASDKYRQTHARAGSRWLQSPEGHVAHLAHKRVSRAVAAGLLLRGPCERCGATRAYAHHPRGYAGAAALDVTWLCQTHHMEAHGRVHAAA